MFACVYYSIMFVIHVYSCALHPPLLYVGNAKYSVHLSDSAEGEDSWLDDVALMYGMFV